MQNNGEQDRPRYGEVWRIVEEPSSGEEWLGVVVSTDAIGLLPWRIVAQVEVDGTPAGLWHVPAPASRESGLQKGAYIDTALLCTIDAGRWSERVGRLPADFMGEVAAAIAILIEFDE